MQFGSPSGKSWIPHWIEKVGTKDQGLYERKMKERKVNGRKKGAEEEKHKNQKAKERTTDNGIVKERKRKEKNEWTNTRKKYNEGNRMEIIKKRSESTNEE